MMSLRESSCLSFADVFCWHLRCIGHIKELLARELAQPLTYFCVIGFLVIFLCIVAPPVGKRFRRVRFVSFYRPSYVGSTTRQHLAIAIRYAACVKQPFQTYRRRQRENYTSFITPIYSAFKTLGISRWGAAVHPITFTLTQVWMKYSN